MERCGNGISGPWAEIAVPLEGNQTRAIEKKEKKRHPWTPPGPHQKLSRKNDHVTENGSLEDGVSAQKGPMIGK